MYSCLGFKKKKKVNENVICGKRSFFVTEVPILARCHAQMGGFLSKKTDLLTFFHLFHTTFAVTYAFIV